MKNASFFARLCAGLIDYVILFVVLYVLSVYLSFNVFDGMINQQMAPFVVINLLILPFNSLIDVLLHPNSYGNIMPYCVMMIFYVIMEILYFSMQEIFWGKSVGKKVLGIKLVSESRHLTVNYFARNIVKVCSKYLYGLLFLPCLFTLKKQTIYDMLTKTIVCDVRNKQ